MYKGKYESQKEPKSPKKDKKTAPVKNKAAKSAPATTKPVKAPAAAEPPKKTGTIVFYSCLLAFILVFAIALGVVMNALNDWLLRFEASQPTVKCQQVFNDLFRDPNWQRIYELAGGGDVSAEDYAEYMRQNYGGVELNYIETSAGLSGDKKYIVRCDTEKIATFTLRNAQPDADIPDWQLGTVEIFYRTDLDITILAQPGYTVLVNGQVLDENHIVRTTTTRAEEYLPEGVHGYRMNEFYIGGLLTEPVVEMLDENGESVKLAFDEDFRFYYQVLEPQISTLEEDDILTEAAQVYCKYMIGAATRTQLKKSFDANSEIYKTIISNETWMQNYKGYELGTAEISEYYRYNDKLYSAQVALTLEVTRRDGTVKEYELCSTFFITEEDGKSLVTQMTNANAQDVFTSVRLTYICQDQTVHTEMVDESVSTLTLPQVTAPEGKELVGWFTRKVNQQGGTTMELAFEPNQDGMVRLSMDQTLEPMTLYALFE